jgi:hypothetical protein
MILLNTVPTVLRPDLRDEQKADIENGWSSHDPQDLRRPQQSTQRSSLAPNVRDYFLPRAVARLIGVAALLASVSFSKPNTAEYLRPTTCAITKLMLISA